VTGESIRVAKQKARRLIGATVTAPAAFLKRGPERANPPQLRSGGDAEFQRPARAPREAVPVGRRRRRREQHRDESMVTGRVDSGRQAEGREGDRRDVNGTGAFLMRAERVGDATMLAQIVRMVSAAQRSRAPIQRIADRVAAWFVPAVALCAATTFVAWVVAGPQPALAHAIVNAVSVADQSPALRARAGDPDEHHGRKRAAALPWACWCEMRKPSS